MEISFLVIILNIIFSENISWLWLKCTRVRYLPCGRKTNYSFYKKVQMMYDLQLLFFNPLKIYLKLMIFLNFSFWWSVLKRLLKKLLKLMKKQIMCLYIFPLIHLIKKYNNSLSTLYNRGSQLWFLRLIIYIWLW